MREFLISLASFFLAMIFFERGKIRELWGRIKAKWREGREC